jgi:hypothetical protein
VLVLVRHEEAVQTLLGHGGADQRDVTGPKDGSVDSSKVWRMPRCNPPTRAWEGDDYCGWGAGGLSGDGARLSSLAGGAVGRVLGGLAGVGGGALGVERRARRRRHWRGGRRCSAAS